MYFLFACPVQRSLFSPNIGAYGTETIKVNLFKESEFTKMFLWILLWWSSHFRKASTVSRVLISQHESAVNSKHMGHGAEAKAASWSAPSQCHEWGKMANYAHKIMCYIHSLSSQLSNFHKHHAIGLVALATGSTCPAHTFLHQTHQWIKYKFTNQHWFLLHSFDKLLRTTNQKTAFHFHSKVKVPHFI